MTLAPLALVLALAAPPPALAPPPSTPRRPVTDTYQGVAVTEDYRWLENGARYPAVLLTAGQHDPRVGAGDPRKMTARLQAATASGRPVLLRVSQGGHGIDSSLDERIAEAADIYAFFLHELGVRWKPPPPVRKR